MTETVSKAGWRQQLAALVLGALVVGSIAMLAVPQANSKLRIPRDLAVEAPAVPALTNGEELLLVLIGGSFCDAADVPGFPEAFDSARRLVRAQATSRGQAFASVGAALDWNSDSGLSWLQEFGDFDEVSSGRNWLNSTAVHYIWRDVPGPTALPQIVIIRRSVEPHERAVSISSEIAVLRRLGAAESMEWVHAGAPVPP